MNKSSEKIIKDPVLDEIHSIQKKHYEERKGLTWDEQKKIIDKNVYKVERKYKLKFKVVQPEDIFILST